MFFCLLTFFCSKWLIASTFSYILFPFWDLYIEKYLFVLSLMVSTAKKPVSSSGEIIPPLLVTAWSPTMIGCLMSPAHARVSPQLWPRTSPAWQMFSSQNRQGVCAAPALVGSGALSSPHSWECIGGIFGLSAECVVFYILLQGFFLWRVTFCKKLCTHLTPLSFSPPVPSFPISFFVFSSLCQQLLVFSYL